jgi:phenylpropionate dioxygenase-like ring-hydroxylating dioxygenase large terminal subunit
MNPILPGAPWLIAHKSMLGVNKPNKISLNDHDYVLWQNRKGEVFAIDNVCPRMQAPLSDGWICPERDTIACPFHALEFDGQGKLYKEGKHEVQAITKPLDIIVANDCI